MKKKILCFLFVLSSYINNTNAITPVPIAVLACAYFYMSGTMIGCPCNEQEGPEAPGLICLVCGRCCRAINNPRGEVAAPQQEQME